MSRKEVFNDPSKVFDVQISSLAKLVYLFLCCEAKENCFVECTRDEIGRKCGVHRNTIAFAINELCEVGLIFKKRQGLNRPNFICLDWGVEDANQTLHL